MKILVVDDIEDQRQIAASILKQLNYQVESAPGGLESIEYMRRQSVDLIVLDMLMDPGINGLETCRRILSQTPDARILIVSGYTEAGMVNEALELGAKLFLKKPYSILC